MDVVKVRPGFYRIKDVDGVTIGEIVRNDYSGKRWILHIYRRPHLCRVFSTLRAARESVS